MLSEHEETQLVNMMVMLDLMKKNRIDKTEIKDIKDSINELKAMTDTIWDTITEEEKNQVLDLYKEKRNDGSTPLPPIE